MRCLKNNALLIVFVVWMTSLNTALSQNVTLSASHPEANETTSTAATSTTTATTTTTRRPIFAPLKQSDLIKAKAMLRWLINNRTENGTHTFNAGFIRLAFHDCVGGCDGCVNLRNPSNVGLNFYKEPLDLMYNEFVVPMMSRADWYALAGFVAVEYAAELTPCDGFTCTPPMEFRWGRKDCLNEDNLFRSFPQPSNDPRATIRKNFRMNLEEIVALMGAHTLGKNHGSGATWVDDGARFDNQYYKDLIDPKLLWRKGVKPGSNLQNTWAHGKTGHNIMLSSDFFMAFDVGTRFADCNINPIDTCRRSNTFDTVVRFSEDNDYWLRRFGQAFSVMLHSGNFGKLKSVEWDIFDEVYTGDESDLFHPDGNFSGILRDPTTTTTTTTATTTVIASDISQSAIPQNADTPTAENITRSSHSDVIAEAPQTAVGASTHSTTVTTIPTTRNLLSTITRIIKESTVTTTSITATSTTTAPPTSISTPTTTISPTTTPITTPSPTTTRASTTTASPTTTTTSTTTPSPTLTTASTTTISPTTTAASTTTTSPTTNESSTTTASPTTTTASTTTAPSTTTPTTAGREEVGGNHNETNHIESEEPTLTVVRTGVQSILAQPSPVDNPVVASTTVTTPRDITENAESTSTQSSNTTTDSRVGYLRNIDFNGFRRRLRLALRRFQRRQRLQRQQQSTPSNL